jgi:hypothetical protein
MHADTTIPPPPREKERHGTADTAFCAFSKKNNGRPTANTPPAPVGVAKPSRKNGLFRQSRLTRLLP